MVLATTSVLGRRKFPGNSSYIFFYEKVLEIIVYDELTLNMWAPGTRVAYFLTLLKNILVAR